MRRRLPPALVLFFLSPAIGELLSSSAPPAEFFQPLGFAMLSVLYGGGALLARELVVRWGAGVPSLLVLGAAYGIAEEGLMCKSFFDPNWMDVGLLGEYGRWLGVNWVWTFELTIYHAAFSILIPVTLVGLLYPDRCDTPWLGRRGFAVVAVLWFLNGGLVFFAISAYRPPLLHLIAASVLIAGLYVLARRWPGDGAPIGREKRAWRPWRLAVSIFLATVAFFALAWAVPQTGIHPLIVILLMLLLTAGVTWFAWRMSGRIGFSDRHKLALVSGALGFFIFIMAPTREWAPGPPDNPQGMVLVGLATLVFLVWLSRRLRPDVMSRTDSDAVSCQRPPAG
jgi:hypothetical protein